jgi:hypothetical protein
MEGGAMNEPMLVVTADDCPGGKLEFSEHEVARATRECRKQIAELRATRNFVRVDRDEGFIAVVSINLGEGIGVRQVTVDPLGISKRLRATDGVETPNGDLR